MPIMVLDPKLPAQADAVGIFDNIVERASREMMWIFGLVILTSYNLRLFRAAEGVRSAPTPVAGRRTHQD